MRFRCAVHLLAGALTLGALAAPALSEAGQAIAHDGSSIYFEVHGSGGPLPVPRAGHRGAAGHTPLLPDSPPLIAEVAETLARYKQAYIDALGSKFRLIFIEYPGNEPKLYTLTPGGGGARLPGDRGCGRRGGNSPTQAFSWGCVTGLQLALRTDRMTALACGGFPVLDGIYEDMLTTTRAMASGPASLYGLEANSPEKRPAVSHLLRRVAEFRRPADPGCRLDIPRLNWIGDQDLPTLNGKPLTHMGQLIVRSPRRAGSRRLGREDHPRQEPPGRRCAGRAGRRHRRVAVWRCFDSLKRTGLAALQASALAACSPARPPSAMALR